MKTRMPETTEKLIQMIRDEFRRKYNREIDTPPPEIAGELLKMIRKGLAGENRAE